MQIIHSKVSAKGDGPDSTRLRPSDWNADHVITLSATGVVIGRITAGPGAAEEIPFASLLPPALVLPTAAIAASSGWVLLFGQAISRSANPKTFAAVGTTYGAGDGSTTFNVPDMRGMVPGGKSNMGGSDRGNLPGGTVLGAVLGGASNAASINIGVSGSFSGGTAGSLGVSVSGNTDPASILSSAPSGGNTVTPNHTHFFTGNGATSGTLSCSGSISGAASGSSAAFSIVQPTLVLNFIMNLG